MADVGPASGITIDLVAHLDDASISAVCTLVHDATEADGVHPLSEHVMLHLRHGGDTPALNALVHAGGPLAAYGHLDLSDQVAGPSAEIVVAPGHRRRGYGRLLVQALVAEVSEGRLRLWAHGEHPAATALAARMGFSRSRVLWQMRRSLYAALPPPQVPLGVTVRTFVPGRDDDAWVTLNRAAFAGHPEQASWTMHDLRARMSEPWFDPGGFFLAERSGDLVGFHWTKVHGSSDHSPHHAHPLIGEVYVVGVHPAEHGKGLGRALTLIGLQHLRQRSLADAMLYVEADNAPAVALYTALGFTRWATDVMFSRDAR